MSDILIMHDSKLQSHFRILLEFKEQQLKDEDIFLYVSGMKWGKNHFIGESHRY